MIVNALELVCSVINVYCLYLISGGRTRLGWGISIFSCVGFVVVFLYHGQYSAATMYLIFSGLSVRGYINGK